MATTFWLMAPFAAAAGPVIGAKLAAAFYGALLALPAYRSRRSHAATAHAVATPPPVTPPHGRRHSRRITAAGSRRLHAAAAHGA